MPSPFPGMDPYLEDAAVWPLFQRTFVAMSCSVVVESMLVDRYRPEIRHRQYGDQGEHEEPYLAIVRRTAYSSAGAVFSQRPIRAAPFLPTSAVLPPAPSVNEGCRLGRPAPRSDAGTVERQESGVALVRQVSEAATTGTLFLRCITVNFSATAPGCPGRGRRHRDTGSALPC